MAEPAKTGKRQEIHLLNRKQLDITGVIRVDSFDSEEFLLETECGFLNVSGQNLHIKSLNLEQGFVSIEGYVHSLGYVDAGSQEKSKGFLGKLFK